MRRRRISAETLRVGVLVMPSGAVLEGRGRPLQPKSAGLPGITRQRVGLPLKIFRLNSLLLLPSPATTVGPRCYTSFWAWTRAFPYAPSPQSGAEETGGVRLPPFFWLDWQHFRGASRVRCPPQFVPSTGGGGFLRFPHAWDDQRLGACAHDRAHGHLSANAVLIVPPRQPTQPSGAPPVRSPQGPTAEGGHASC